MDAVKVACVQAAPVFLDLQATLDKTASLVREAAGNGAKLVAFPETWLPGYPWWIWLGAPIEGMKFLPQYHANSIALGSPEMARLQEIAADSAVTLVTGFSERDGGSRYMSQAIIGPEGDLLLVRRKLKPTYVERSVFGEGDGSGLTVVSAPFGRVGALNCWEHIQPLVKMALYAQGEEIHVASWPSFSLYRDVAYSFGPEVSNGVSMIYALEGGCFVLASTALISQQMLDVLCDRPEKIKLLSPLTGRPGGGFSMIYGPDGHTLCSPLPEDEEGILYADLDPTKIVISKSAADPVGHYSRPDAVRLVVDKTRRKVMRVVGEDVPSVAEQEIRPLEDVVL